MILTTAIIKGGTGKTTSAVALAQAAAAEKKRVLLVDLDPQANATLFVGADQSLPGAYQALHGASASDVIQHTEQSIDVIAGHPDLAGETTATGSAMRLRKVLEPITESYDVIIIDTAPAMGELLYNALVAADGILIPLEADTNSLQGLYKLQEMAAYMSSIANTNLKITGVIISRYDGRPKLNQYLRDQISIRCSELGIPYLMEIRPSISIREAQAMQQSLYSYAATSKPAQDYMQLYKTIFGDE